MIRLNLLGVTRIKPTPRWHALIGPTVVWVLVALAQMAAGWQYRALRAEGAAIEKALAEAREEGARSAGWIDARQDLEAQRKTIAEQVAVFDEARRDQELSVRLLFVVASSLPEGLVLAELQRAGSDVSIEGRGVTHAAVAEFLARLDASALFPRPVELERSEAQSTKTQGLELAPIHFALRAHLAADSQESPRKTAGAGTNRPAGASKP